MYRVVVALRDRTFVYRCREASLKQIGAGDLYCLTMDGEREGVCTLFFSSDNLLSIETVEEA